MRWLDEVTLFFVLFMCGNELAVSAFINPALWRTDNPAMAGEFASSLGAAMPAWYALCLVLLALEAYLGWQRPGHVLVLAAAVLWAVVILCTVTMLVPLNNRLALLKRGTAVPDWLKISKQWDTLHRIRIASLTVAAVLFYNGLRR
jgi:uncharacterized membrane protein